MASCPNCGFDLAADGSCSVCGYGKENTSEAAASGTKQTANSTTRSGARRSLFLIAAGVVVAAVVIVAAIVLAGKQTGDQPVTATTRSQAASANAPNKSTAKATQQTPARTAKSASAATTVQTQPKKVKYDPAKYEQNPYYRVAVGASPLAVRAAKPLDLYDPSHQPVYNLDNLKYPPITNEADYVAWMRKHYPSETEHFLKWRWQRASIAVQRHRITHRRVLEAFLLTPREWFVRKYNLDKTYANTAIPIGFGQTISGPDLVSNMTNALDPQPNQKVLEIGTGSGYQSAFLSSLSNFCYTIEIVRPLAEQTNQIYLSHTKAMPQFANIHRRAADGYYGWKKYAPFDRIIVTTGIDHIPPELLKELKPGGIMVIPVGPPTGQVVLKITKTVDKSGQIHLTREDIYHGLRKEIFVPFTAASGGTHNTGAAKK